MTCIAAVETDNGVWIGIPKPGRNAATGELDLDAEWTTAYTDVTKITANDWRAFVEPVIAGSHPDGLGEPCDPPYPLQLNS